MPLGALVAAAGSLAGSAVGKAIGGGGGGGDIPINFQSSLSGLSRVDLERLLADLTKAEGIARGDIEGSLEDVLATIQTTQQQVQELAGPAQQANTAALEQLQRLSGIGGFDQEGQLEALQQTPGFQFRFQQGQQAVERSGAARGLLESGAILKGLTEFGQGLASTEFGAEQARLLGLANATSNQALQGQGSLQTLGLAGASAQQGAGQHLADISSTAAQQRASGLLSGGTRFNKSIALNLGGLEKDDFDELKRNIPGISRFFPGSL